MNKTFPWQELLFICAFMLVFAVVFQSLPPLFTFMISSLDITHAQAGALMSLFALPGILISIPGGILADAYGAKRVGIVALAITLVGSVIVALANNYLVLVAGRIISGIGALTIAVIAPQALSRRFAKQNLGRVMGIFNMVMPLATIVTLNTFGRLAAEFSWRLPLLLAAGYALIILGLFSFRFPRSLDGEKAKQKFDLKSVFNSLKNIGWPIWLVAAVWMMYNAASISYLSFAADYFANIGHSHSYAGFLTSLLMIGSLILSPLVGSLIDKYGREEHFIILGSVALALLFWLVPRLGVNPLIPGILIGISAPLIPAPVFALVPRFLQPEQTGLGYGILSTCLNVGVLAGPYVIGLSYDLTFNYSLGFNLMAIFALSTAAFAFVLRRIENKGETNE